MKKIILLLIIGILSTTTVSALDKYYEVTVNIERHKIFLEPELVEVRGVNVVYDSVEHPQYIDAKGTSVYEFILYSKTGDKLTQNNAILSFTVSDGERILNKIEGSILLEHNPLAYRLEIINKGKILRDYVLPNLCNNNGVCDGNETYLSCSLDCPSYLQDGNACTPIHDNICDTDCPKDVDPDCAVVEIQEKVLAAEAKRAYILPFAVVSGVLIVLFILFKLAVKKKKKA